MMENNKHNRELDEQIFDNENAMYKSIKDVGSLGLLAYGYRGLFLWRKKRKELSQKEEGQKDE